MDYGYAYTESDLIGSEAFRSDLAIAGYCCEQG